MGERTSRRTGFVFFCNAVNTSLESNLKRIIRPGKQRSGKVVGRYYIAEDEGGRIELTLDKFNREFRHTVEFVLEKSPYQMPDLMRLDCLTFFRLVNECEQREREAIDRLEKQTHGGT